MGNGVITSVASSVDGNEAYVANARGLFEIVDLRAGRTRGKFRGNSGSIRQIAVHPDGAHVACGGLDQYVRVYDVKTKRAVASAYAKQALTSIVFDAYTPEVEAANAKATKKKAKKSSKIKVDADGSVRKLKKKVKRADVSSDSEKDAKKKTKKKLKMRIE
jgi:WD40 repeat protein